MIAMFNLKLILGRIYHNDLNIIDLSNEYCIDYTKNPIVKYIGAESSNVNNGNTPWKNLIPLLKKYHFACNLWNIIYIWNLDAKKLEKCIFCDSAITSLLCLPSGQLLSAHEDKTIQIWNPESGEYLGNLSKFPDVVNNMKLLYDKFATLTDDGIIQLWDIKSKKQLYPVLNMSVKSVHMMAVYKSQKVITSSKNYIIGQLYLNKINKYKMLDDKLNITAILFDVYDWFICGDQNGSIYMFDLSSFECKKCLRVGQGKVNSLTLLPDGNVIATFEDHIICIFRPETGRILQIIKTESNINDTIVLSDGRIVGVAVNGDFYNWQFPKRALNGCDIFLITISLEENKSVKLLNYSNVTLNDKDISYIDDLRKGRNDLTISGVVQSNIDYEKNCPYL